MALLRAKLCSAHSFIRDDFIILIAAAEGHSIIALMPAGRKLIGTKGLGENSFQLLLRRQIAGKLQSQALFVFEDGAVRHVYTDGRPHPPNDELWPTSQGDSIGHWEGETLVVDTVAREAGPVMVGPAAILSERAQFTERVRRIGKNVLEDQMTIEDPLRFSAPWHLRLLYGRVTEMNRMVAWNCDNDRNPVVNGKLTIAPP